MRTALCSLWFCLLVGTAGAQVAPPPDEARTVGQPVPDVELIGDDGTPFRLSAFAGTPVIVSPIFTRCPHVCPMITSSLLAAVSEIDGLGSTYQVVTVSFDPDDTVEDLAAYRQRLDLPAQWHLAIARPAELDALLGALDFNYVALDGGGFAHANLIAVIDTEDRVSGYLHGVQYTTEEVRRALTSAWAGQSLVEKYRPWIFGIAALSLLVAVFTIVITGRRGARAVAA